MNTNIFHIVTSVVYTWLKQQRFNGVVRLSDDSVSFIYEGVTLVINATYTERSGHCFFVTTKVNGINYVIADVSYWGYYNGYKVDLEIRDLIDMLSPMINEATSHNLVWRLSLSTPIKGREI